MRKYKEFLKSLVKERKITPSEKLANRVAYMGTGFLILSPYLIPYGDIGGYTYLIGAVLTTPQVWLAKQWNLVLLNGNLLVGYGIFLWG
tara:strand:+ start:66 stop:332 length:267 start_codon:yes stop_codon:yes gene_type:complete